MKNAARKTWVKVLCAFLTALFAAGAAISLVAVGKLADSGVYDGIGEVEFRNSLLESQLQQEIVRIQDYARAVENGSTSVVSHYKMVFGSEASNLCFTVRDSSGTVVLSNGSDTAPLAGITATISVDNADYAVELAVRHDLAAADVYRDIVENCAFLYGARYWLIAAVCVLTVLGLALFVFLLYGAGRREGTDEIALRWVDKIPCDLYTLLLVLAIVGIGSAAMQCSWDFYADTPYLPCGLAAAGIALLGTLLCMSWAARIRVGKWWRHSVIFSVLHWLKKPAVSLVRLIKSLPLIWRTALIALAVFLFQVIFYASRATFLWLLLNLALCLAALYLTLDARRLRATAQALADGNFDGRLDTSKMHWEFKAHGEDLNRIGDGISLAVEKQMKSERMKTELITNVSHDIKTPLTSIINYVDLLKKEDVQPEEAREYIAVLDRQSQRLRKLTEDVIEASKASTGNIPVELSKTDMNVLLSQAAGEYEDKLAARKLELVLSLAGAPLPILADGRLLWRVFDNLMGNAVKYALPGTRVYVTTAARDSFAQAEFKNISAAQLNISADELMERFTRGDASRNTEGSGLGLSIADSLTRLQGGQFGLTIDGDLFKATVRFALRSDAD